MVVVELTDNNFKKEAIEAKLPVLVDFWAPWCSPCKMAEPVIEELAREHEGKIKVGKVDVDKNPRLAPQYGVLSIPTVIVFKEGKEVGRRIGFPGKKGYEELIKEAIKLT